MSIRRTSPRVLVTCRGLTAMESLVVLLLCVLLLWIVIPAGLVQFGIIKSENVPTAETVGLADYNGPVNLNPSKPVPPNEEAADKKAAKKAGAEKK